MNVATTVRLTPTLRTSSDPEWEDARRRLRAVGVDIESSVLTDVHPSGAYRSTAIVATPEGRVFVFDLLFKYGPASERLENGVRVVDQWKEVTEHAEIVEKWQLPNLYLQAVLIARRLAETESGQ